MSLVKSKNRRVDEDADAGAPDRSLMCRANGCPNRWSVQTGDVTACSYHAWEDPKEWPRITEQLLRFGPWKLETPAKQSPTVRDMLTRVKGHIGNLKL